MANTYSQASGWGTPELIETIDAGNAKLPWIEAGADGVFTAVWFQLDGARNDVLSNRYTPGAGWGVAQLLETEDAGSAFNPRLAVHSDGTAMAVWSHDDGARRNIMANLYSPGTGWGTAELIESDNIGNATRPQVKFDSAGDAIAVWLQVDGAFSSTYSNRYTVGSGWGTPELLETEDLGNAFGAQLAVTDDDRVVAIWHQSDGNVFNIWANTYTAGGGWETALKVEDDDQGTANNARLVVGRNGVVTANWEQSDGTIKSIMSSRFKASEGWSTPTFVETDDVGDAKTHKIAVDGDGNITAVWAQDTGAFYELHSNRFDPLVLSAQ